MANSAPAPIRPSLRVVPARQRLGAGQPVVARRRIAAGRPLDLVAVDRVQQIGLELRGGAPGRVASPSAQASRRPCWRPMPASVWPSRSSIDSALSPLTPRSRATRGDSRSVAAGAGDRPGDRVGQLPGEQLPALAAAGFVGDQQEIAAAAARRQPRPSSSSRGEMRQPRGDFGQRGIARRLAIGQIDRIEAPQAQQQGVSRGPSPVALPVQSIRRAAHAPPPCRAARSGIALGIDSLGSSAVMALPCAKLYHTPKPLPKRQRAPYQRRRNDQAQLAPCPAGLGRPPAPRKPPPRCARCARLGAARKRPMPLVVLGGDGYHAACRCTACSTSAG